MLFYDCKSHITFRKRSPGCFKDTALEEFIPLSLYTVVYYNVLLITVFAAYLHSSTHTLASVESNGKLRFLGVIFVAFVIFFIGLRPIDPVFIDMTMYNHMFNLFAEGDMSVLETEGDIGFLYFIQFCSKIMTPELFFLFCAVIYIVPLVIACVRWFKGNWFYGFLMLVISFSFLGYGVNGIRNGMATSIFLLAVSFYNRRVIMALLLLLSFSFHKSMSLPIAGFCITFFYNDMRTYLKTWFFAIPISLIAGSFFVAFFSSLGFDDSRVGIYFSEDVVENTVTGFRWDFILYSAIGIFAGWYYIVKQKFQDRLYIQLYNVFVIANMFWLLIIRASFSNRFAYLSWFLLAIIVVYPLLKVKLMPNQHLILGRIVFIYFMFTYVMNFILF